MDKAKFCTECGGTDCVRQHQPTQRKKMTKNVQECPVCKKIRKLSYKKDNQEVCAKCAGVLKKIPHDMCDICGKKNQPIILIRQDGERVGRCCYHTPVEECVSCGRDRAVHQRTEKGPLCKGCYQAPLKKCIACGKEQAVAKWTGDGPLCKNCNKITCWLCKKTKSNTVKKYGMPLCRSCRKKIEILQFHN